MDREVVPPGQLSHTFGSRGHLPVARAGRAAHFASSPSTGPACLGCRDSVLQDTKSVRIKKKM